jgi:hypothetical protein
VAQPGGYNLDQGHMVVGVTAAPERGDHVGVDVVFE